MRQPGIGRSDELGLVLVEMDAMREQRVLVEPVVLGEPLHGVHVDRILRGMHVDADIEVGGDPDARLQRLVGEGERRVCADEAPGERPRSLP